LSAPAVGGITLAACASWSPAIRIQRAACALAEEWTFRWLGAALVESRAAEDLGLD
jgi:hypothetical protein